MPASRGGGPQPERDWSTLRSREAWRPASESGGSWEVSGGGSIGGEGRSSGSGCGGSGEAGTTYSRGAGSAGGGGCHTGETSLAAGGGGSSASHCCHSGPSASGSLITGQGQLAFGDKAGRATAASASCNAEGNEFSVGVSRAGFQTDAEITGGGEMHSGTSNRDLKRFDFASHDARSSNLEGTLEELGGGKRSLKAWDQFKVNEEKFGVVSTFKADLSQYTTVLDKKKVTREMRQTAERIAREVERGGSVVRDEEYCEDGEADEEDLFSAVQRQPPEKCVTSSEIGGTSDAAGRALLASLRAAPGAVRGVGGDHRALVTPKVQAWWRARRISGATVPQGAEVALVCPFSRRVLGDVSQLVTHWASALPRAVDLEGSGETPSMTASQHFGRLAQELRWSQMSEAAGLEPALPITAPRPGSVWEQILARVAREPGGGNRAGDDRNLRGGESCSVADRPVSEFITEAVRLRCWRRDQKIEHREVMEGIAAGLAIYALSTSLNGSAAAWDAFDDSERTVVSKRVVGMCH